MSKKFLILFALSVLCSFGANAFPDTLYFGADWKPASKNQFTYFRVLEVKDDVILVTDHYSSGCVQMLGTIKYSEESLKKAESSQNVEGYELGEFKWFNENGTIYYSIDYTPSLDGLDSLQRASVNTDSLRYERTYFMDGIVKEEGLVTGNGTPHGTWIERHKKTGQTKKIIHYNNGIVTGTCVAYRYDGIIRLSTEYCNGIKHGKEKYFDNQGRLKVTNIYENGQLVKKHKRYLSITRRR